MTRKPTGARTVLNLTPAGKEARRANGKLGGRPKGAKTDMSMVELRAKCREWTPKILAEFAWLALHSPSDAIRLAAGREILDRGYGRPAQRVAVAIGGEDGSMAKIVISTGVPRLEGELPCFPGSSRLAVKIHRKMVKIHRPEPIAWLISRTPLPPPSTGKNDLSCQVLLPAL